MPLRSECLTKFGIFVTAMSVAAAAQALLLPSAQAASACHEAFTATTTKEEGLFLRHAMPRLHEEISVKKLHERVFNKPVSDPLRALQNWVDYLNKVYPQVMRSEARRKQVTASLVEPYVIKELAPSYLEMQNQRAREQGRGDLKTDPETIRQLLNNVQKQQRDSLSEWLNYLLSEDTKMQPVWIKVWIFVGVTKLGTFDKEQGSFNQRSAKTTAPFPELNREALAQVVDAVVQALQKRDLQQITDVDVQKIIKDKKPFADWYAHALKQLTTTQFDQSITSGQWVTYRQGSDPKPLVAALAHRNTGWCTAGLQTARSQLQMGDIFVYYSHDSKGAAVHPRIAIRMEDHEIVEVRGIAEDQGMDPEIARTSVLKQKLSGFGEKAEEYLKKEADMKLMTLIEQKTQQNQILNEQELDFLYELKSPIEGFGYDRDPRISDVIYERMQKNPEDFEYLLTKGQHGDGFVRFHALFQAQKLRPRDARLRELLLAALKDPSPPMRELGLRSLRSLQLPESYVLDVLLEKLSDKNEDGHVRSMAATILGQMNAKGENVIDALAGALSDPNWSVRHHAAESLVKMQPELRNMWHEIVDMGHIDAHIRAGCARGLGEMNVQNPYAIHALKQRLDDPSAEVREAAAWALGEIKPQDPQMKAALIKKLKDKSEKVRKAAEKSLEALGHSSH